MLLMAVEVVYGDDIEDSCDMEKELAKYMANPASAVSWETLRKRRAQVSRQESDPP